jgi:hypothetical protein
VCKLSSQLKLCTCDVGSVDRLEHYWVLHRFDPRKDDSVIGKLFMPHTLDGRVEAYNRSLLLQRLQEGDAFDVDLKPREGDRLQLTFRCSEADASESLKGKIITYGYAWSAGRWVEQAFDPLSWRARHDEERFGEVRPALER